MQRTDRLYELIRLLRDGRVHRAADLATRLGVSDRTVYRDMETLMASGVPVAGARGLGYQMTEPITLPPLNLTRAELEALHLGMAVVGDAEDPELQAAARSLSAKIDGVLPEDRNDTPKGWGLAVYPLADAAAGFRHMPHLRAAIRARQKVRIVYPSETGEPGVRTIRPLALDYWGRVWTVAAWCERDGDFRVFRVDRIEELNMLPALFVEEPGKALADYQAQFAS